MASKGTVGGKIVLEGESQYRAALKNIKSEQTQLRSEMKLCQTSFKESQNSLAALNTKYEILTKQVESQSKKVKVYSDALDASKKVEEDAAKKVDDLQKALESAEKEMGEMEGSSEDTSDAVEEQAKAIDELKNKLALAEQDYDKASQKTASYQTSLNYANIELQGMQDQLSQTEKYMKEAENSTDECATSIDKYGNETQEATEETSTFGSVLKANLASEVIIAGVKKLASAIKSISESAVEAGESFEASMSQVAATMGMTTEEVDSGSASYTLLSDAAKECGKSTMFSASEAAEALNYLALAGYDAEKSAETLPKVLNLAAAGSLDLAYASDLVTDSMAALGLETDQLDNYIDEMAKTSQKSNTSVSQLGEATLVCAGTVSLAGQSLETMNTELGVLANNGIKGAEGGTHLRNVILALTSPTDKAALALDDLGVAIYDDTGNMRDLNDIMVDLNSAMSEMSSDEKTSYISRIFNKTDIASVNALLKGTGDEYDNLNTEIKNCSGAASDMADTLNNNLKGKVTILQSALEGLGISAYEIFDDEMKTSVESATDAVGRLQKSMDSGDLGVSMRKFSQSLSELVDGAVDFGEDALPTVIDGLTWIMDNSEMITVGITGITAATIYHSKVAPMIETVTGAWNTYKTANEGATVSQWLLNAAMDANPAGILVTAIVGLTAALVTYAAITKDNGIAISETAQKTKELVQAAKELNETYAQSTEERKASRASMETEAATCSKLADELSGLQSKTNLTAEEQARQKAIVDQLNTAMPELNLAIDEQTGKLNMSTKELKKNVDALMAQAKAEAAREDLAEIAEEQYEAEKQLADLQEQLKEQTYQVNIAQQQYTDTLQKLNEATLENAGAAETMYSAAEECSNKLETEKQAQADLQEQIDATKETISNYTDEYANTLDYISDTEPVEDAASAISEMGTAAESAGSSISGMSATAQAAFEDMYESLSETISDQINLFEEFDGAMVTSGEGMLANMQSQVDGLSQWADNIQELADRGINQGLLQTLADMGPEGAGYVAAFVDMTDEELQKANDLYVESLSLSDDVAAQVAESYAKAGEDAVTGYTGAITNAEQTITESGKSMGEELLEGTNEALDRHSPSKEYQAIGEDVVAGLIAGIKGEQNNAILTIENLANSMVTSASTILSESTFAEIGGQITNGMITGINSGKSGVVRAIENLCTEAVESARESLDIHSPSRKFEYFGEMSGKGYLLGWKESMSDVDTLIASTLPDLAVAKNTATVTNNAGTSKVINVTQNISIYGEESNLIETSRKFKQLMREAAKDW